MKGAASTLFVFLIASSAAASATTDLFDADTEAEAEEGETAGWVIDYLEATSHHFSDDDADADADGDYAGGVGSDYAEVASYLLEAEADVGPSGISDPSSVDAGAYGEEPSEDDNIFADSPPPQAAGVGEGPNMLERQIICGYQGWFGFPGDGAPINRWRHWFRGNFSSPAHEHVTVDMYPTTDDYDADDLKATGMKMRDGSDAKFFSSARPNVVRRHFEWMVAYGITGVFHHRFMTEWNTPLHETRTIVLRNVRSAAVATGRYFAVSYDIAGNGNAVIDRLRTDWMTLVDAEGITNSSQYIRQNGLPVLHIFGVGLASIAVNDTVGMMNLIRWLQSPSSGRYRAFVLGGVPGRWRSGTVDSRPGTAWKAIYDSLDGIQPWHVGRWDNPSQFDAYYSDHISRDAAYCKARGVLYMPTMWPGFSWHNLKSASDPRPAINSIPRIGGTFMWNQAFKYVANPNITSIWIAQFDEVDEGTAIFKVAAEAKDLPLPLGGWLALDADGGRKLPSDWYLRLAGEAQRMLERKRALTPTIPLDPDAAWVPYTSGPTGRPSAAPTPSATTRTVSPTNVPTGRPTDTTSTSAPASSIPTTAPTTSIPTSTTQRASPTNEPTRQPTSARPDGPKNTPTGQPASTQTGRRISSKPTSRLSKADRKETKTSRPSSPSTPTSRPSSPLTLKPGSKADKKETKGRKNPPS